MAAARAKAAGTRKIRSESVKAIYFATGGDVAADGRRAVDRLHCLQTAHRFRAAGGGLSDDSSRHVLSRRKPGCFRVRHHRAARTAVRPVARTQPDDFDQLRRQLDHHAAIRAQPEH